MTPFVSLFGIVDQTPPCILAFREHIKNQLTTDIQTLVRTIEEQEQLTTLAQDVFTIISIIEQERVDFLDAVALLGNGKLFLTNTASIFLESTNVVMKTTFVMHAKRFEIDLTSAIEKTMHSFGGASIYPEEAFLHFIALSREYPGVTASARAGFSIKANRPLEEINEFLREIDNPALLNQMIADDEVMYQIVNNERIDILRLLEVTFTSHGVEFREILSSHVSTFLFASQPIMLDYVLNFVGSGCGAELKAALEEDDCHCISYALENNHRDVAKQLIRLSIENSVSAKQLLVVLCDNFQSDLLVFIEQIVNASSSKGEIILNTDLLLALASPKDNRALDLVNYFFRVLASDTEKMQFMRGFFRALIQETNFPVMQKLIERFPRFFNQMKSDMVVVRELTDVINRWNLLWENSERQVPLNKTTLAFHFVKTTFFTAVNSRNFVSHHSFFMYEQNISRIRNRQDSNCVSSNDESTIEIPEQKRSRQQG